MLLFTLSLFLFYLSLSRLPPSALLTQKISNAFCITNIFISTHYYIIAIKILQLGQYIFLTNLTNILWRDIAMRELDFEKIGKKIKELRLEKGLTQEYIAHMADVNTSHISNIENNRVKISLSTLVQICNALNTTVDYVISSEYISADTPLEQEILTALKPLPIDTKEKVLKIIHIL